MLSKNINSKMKKIIKSLGCEVYGIDLKTENRPKSMRIFIVNYYCY
jgi:ribosome maturation factor RimP